mmetsp:Transcript_119315/g.207688  ORF Transcript_119315/g.207688 Transcript_119315/m.207688 type:complete len:283 (-) Transcript_119315:572-1420(-)
MIPSRTEITAPTIPIIRRSKGSRHLNGHHRTVLAHRHPDPAHLPQPGHIPPGHAPQQLRHPASSLNLGPSLQLIHPVPSRPKPGPSPRWIIVVLMIVTVQSHQGHGPSPPSTTTPVESHQGRGLDLHSAIVVNPDPHQGRGPGLHSTIVVLTTAAMRRHQGHGLDLHSTTAVLTIAVDPYPRQGRALGRHSTIAVLMIAADRNPRQGRVPIRPLLVVGFAPDLRLQLVDPHLGLGLSPSHDPNPRTPSQNHGLQHGALRHQTQIMACRRAWVDPNHAPYHHS